MSSDIAIKVFGISKSFHVYEKPIDRLKQSLYRGRRQFFRDFKALDNVSFNVKKGETIGIIGRNGSGKSTLLQIICGTLTPSDGVIEFSGRVAALLELGAGFNPEFTGRENVYMNASILGLNKQQIDAKFDEILEFSGIGEYIEQPVKTYSSGMYVRLAFAVIAHVDADILIIDEALSVGDAFFVQKCMRFLREFMKKGTVLFVSHDTGAIVNLCDRVIWLESGVVRKEGVPREVSKLYLESMYEDNGRIRDETSAQEGNTAKTEIEPSEYRDMRHMYVNCTNLRNDLELFEFREDSDSFGIGGARVELVRLLDEEGAPLSWIVGGERAILEIVSVANADLVSPIVGFFLKDKLGQNLFGDNTYLRYREDPVLVKSGSRFVTRFEFIMPVLPVGEYAVAVAIAEGTQDDHVQHQWLHEAMIIVSHSSSVCQGLIGVPMQNIEIDVKQG